MNKLLSLTLSAGLVAASTASAKVSFTLAIEALTQADGVSAISDSGLLVLVVDTGDDGFQLPGDGSLVSGNDEVVTYWDLDDYSFTSADITLTTDGGVDYGANWSEDDSLALFWFPDLSASNMVPGSDTAYGVFADAAGFASGDAWRMPADGTFIHSLRLLTTAATQLILAGTGEQPSLLGATAFAVSNPPSSEAPDAPSLAVSNGGGSSTLTWTATGAPSGFIVQRRAPSGAWESIGVVDGDETQFVDTDVKPGREYEYRLYSVGAFASTISNLPAAILSERSLLTNVSARSRVVAGNANTQMFGGVIVEGSDPTKNIVVQAIGESFLGNGFIADPTVDFYESGQLVSSNDDWLESVNALAIDDSMAIGNAIQLPGDGSSKDSSELIEAKPNAGYSFAVGSKEGDTADVFLGIFDADYTDSISKETRITNLAARGFLGADANSLLAGSIIVKGNVPKEVLVMAWGPYLAKADTSLEGLTIEDPELYLYKGEDIIASNDNWETQTVSEASGVTFETDPDRIRRVVEELGYSAFDQGSVDAMLLMTVDPGAYAFAYEGKGGTGIGFITIDEVEVD